MECRVGPRQAGSSQPAGPVREGHVRRDGDDQTDLPVSVRTGKEVCQMQRKSLQAKELRPRPTGWRFRLRLTVRGLTLVKRNRS